MRAFRWVPVTALAFVAACAGASDKSPAASATPTAPTPTAAVVTTVRVALADTAPMMGAATQATATVWDQSNNAVTGKTVTWKSSSDSLATVDASGLVTAKMRGSVTITASVDGKSGTGALRVVPTPPYDCDIEDVVGSYVVCSKRIVIDGVPVSRLLRYSSSIDIDKDGITDLAFMPTLDEWYQAHPNRSESDWHWRNNVRFPITLLRGTSRKGEFTTFLPSVTGGAIDANLVHEGEQILTIDVNGDGINDFVIGDASEYSVPINTYPMIGAQHFIYLSTGVGSYRKIRIGDSTFTTHGMTVGTDARDGFAFIFNSPWSCALTTYPLQLTCPTKLVGHVSAQNVVTIDTIRTNMASLNSPQPMFYSNWYSSSMYVMGIDIDNRGHKDVVEFSAGRFGAVHHIWRKTSAGWQFLDSLISNLPANNPDFTGTNDIVEGALVADVNGDGFDDLILNYLMGRKMRVWLNNRRGSFDDATMTMLGFNGNLPTAWSPIQGIDTWVCDVNNDGKPDIFQGGLLTVYVNGSIPLQPVKLPFGFPTAFGAHNVCVGRDGMHGLLMARKALTDNTNNFSVIPNYATYIVSLRNR